MLKNIKQKNEKLIAEHFEQVFGEGYKVEVNWGMPVMAITITATKDDKVSSWRIAFNMENESYELSTKAVKTVDGKEEADWATLTKEIVEFVIKRSIEISEQLFITREVPQEETKETKAEPEVM